MRKIICVLTFLMESILVLSSHNTIHVNNCFNESFADKNAWTRSIVFEMSAYSIENLNLQLTWEIYKMSNGAPKTTKVNVEIFKGSNFVIPPYSLTQGLYNIIVLPADQPDYKMKQDCFLRIRPELAFAFIAGGSVQEYRPKEIIIVNGAPSQDYCYPKYKQNSLVYHWTCSQKVGNKLCPFNIKGKVNQFTIPKEYVVEGEEFYVTLTVENEDHSQSTAVQRILVKSNVRHLQMSCKRNCPPWSRSDSDIVLAVNCIKYCQDPCKGSWVLNPNPNTTLLENAEIYKSDIFFYRVFNPGNIEFIYNCQGTKVSGHVSLKINFKPNPRLLCEIKPKEGMSFSTEFQISCEFEPKEQIQTIEVFLFDEAADNGLGDFITIWTPPVTHTFNLPGETEQISIRVSVHSKVYFHTVLNVTVTKEFQIDDSEKSIIKTIDLYMGNKEQSVKHYLVRVYDSNKAVAKIRSFWRDIDPASLETDVHAEDVHNLMLHSIDDLLTIPILTADNLIQMNDAIKSMLSSIDGKLNAFKVKHLSILCKKLGFDLVKLSQNKDDESLQSTIKKINVVQTLADCADKIVAEDDEILPRKNVTSKPPSKEGNVTTVVPVEKGIVEDYADYVDHSKEYYTHLEDLEEAISNVLKLSSVLAKFFEQSIEGDYGSKMFSSKTLKITVYRHPGKFYVDDIKGAGVAVQSSRDIHTSQHNFVFKLISWNKNIFWWSHSEYTPTTYLSDISIIDLDTNEVVSKFDAPHYIHLKILNDTTHEVAQQNFTIMVPARFYIERSNEEYKNRFIQIHRIDLFEHQGLLVEFHDLEDREFDVVIKNFELPTIEDFVEDKMTLVDEDNPYVTHENHNPYDSWFYVGILPHTTMVDPKNGNQSFDYSIRFFGPACYKWSFDKEWKRSCVASMITKEYIACKCNHLSVIAGNLETVISKDMDMSNPELEITLIPQREIFYCVFAMFSIFSILLLYGKRKHEIYYAADNNYNDRYAYLIVVRTGRFRQLTSRIVIKIVGSRDTSPPHVLNYPDPYYRIFQAGCEDWIIVTTPETLGNILNIELWHDSFGLKPTWYCKDISIHDIQTREKWVFRINQVISVCHEYRVKVAPLGTGTKRQQISESLSLSSDYYIWNIFADWIHHTTSFIERLLFLYSKVLSPLLITLMWHGFPKMQNLDSLDSYHKIFDGYLFLMGFGSSLISFLMHTALYNYQSKSSIMFTIPILVLSNSCLIIFGFWVPYYSSIRIIIAWIFGLILDLLIYTHSLKMLRKLVYGKKLLDTTKGISYENILKEVEIQRETLHQIFERIFIFRLHQMTIPLKGKKFRHRKREDIRRTNLGQQLKDLVMFGIYIILLHAVVSSEKDHLVFHDYMVLIDIFRGNLTRTRNLYENVYISDIYDYINTTLIEALHSQDWYPHHVDGEPGMLIGKSNKYIGVARLRQHRVKSVECDVDFLPENTVCSPPFSTAYEDRRMFEGGWDHPVKYLSVRKRLSSMWIYKDDYKTGTRSYLGHYAIYPGGGYVINMGRTRYNSITNFNVIKDERWIDRFTRSIFIEFLTYNANYNLFNSIRIIIERDATGDMNSRTEIEPARMMYVGNELERRSLLYSIIFVVWLLVLFLNKTKLILREKLSYLKNFWSLLDLIIILISICAIIIYVARIKSIGHLLNTLETVKHNRFLDYFSLFRVHVALNIIASLLVCASTIRLWKLMRFFKMFTLFEKTIILVMKPVGALFLHQFVFLCACMMAGHIMYGENLMDFCTVKKSFKSLVKIYFNLYSNYALSNFQTGLPYIGLTVLVLFILFSRIFLALYVVIVMSSHLDTKELFSRPREKAYSFVGFIKEELTFIFRWFRPKLTHHKQSGKKPVIYPKPDKYLFANCVSTTTHLMNSMTAIAATSLCKFLHKDDQDGLTERETILMLRVCHSCLTQHITDDRKEFFYRVQKGMKMKVIDSKRMNKAKIVAEIILGVSQKMERKQRMNRMMVLRHTLRDLEKAQAKLDVCYRSLQNIEVVEDTEV